MLGAQKHSWPVVGLGHAQPVRLVWFPPPTALNHCHHGPCGVPFLASLGASLERIVSRLPPTAPGCPGTMQVGRSWDVGHAVPTETIP